MIISSDCGIPASCDYWRWGSGGRQENINAICVLGLNMINDKVFLILWWWFLFLAIVGALRLLYRLLQTRSSTVRYQLINMRMNRYFRSSHKTVKIENYLNNCKLGDWFVLYQLSKNLNRPFFMDFLTTLSVRFAHGHVCDEEDPEETGALLNQMGNYLKPSAKVVLYSILVTRKYLHRATTDIHTIHLSLASPSNLSCDCWLGDDKSQITFFHRLG